MVLPAFAVLLLGRDVGIKPRNANTDKPNPTSALLCVPVFHPRDRRGDDSVVARPQRLADPGNLPALGRGGFEAADGPIGLLWQSVRHLSPGSTLVGFSCFLFSIFGRYVRRHQV